MNTAGLSTDQAPPLKVPLSFYALVPLAMIAAGVLLAVDGASLLLTPWLPRTVALVHLGTLGMLLAVMLGSLYQMVPVVIGQKVPGIRLAHLVMAALAIGVGALVFGLWTGAPGFVRIASFALGGALVAFVVPVSIALGRARGGETLLGMRVAMVSLLALAALGLRLAWGHGGGEMPASRATLLIAHVDLALVGWVGGLIMAVSWQVVPMFYLTAEFPPRLARALAWTLLASVVAVSLAAALDAPIAAVMFAALPGALVVWVVQPLMLARLIKHRRRRRRDPTLQFWWIALGSAPLVLAAVLYTWLGEWAPSTQLLGWLSIVGWAGATVHGMLTRIVPFLTWFHRFAAMAGRPEAAEVPPMKRLLPDEQVRVQLGAHALTLATGAAAIALRHDLLSRATGVLLASTGVLLGAALISVLWRAR